VKDGFAPTVKKCANAAVTWGCQRHVFISGGLAGSFSPTLRFRGLNSGRRRP
jgi:hypothetical protein